jgi:F0F1-type ATP synthase assembly protein I
MNEPNKNDSPYAVLGWFFLIVTDFVLFTGLGVLLGFWLVKEIKMPSWILVVTSTIGLGLAIFRLYKAGKKF